MAKLSHFSKFSFSAIRATVNFAFDSAHGRGGSRPSNYTHLGHPREMSVNRLPARSVLEFVRFLPVNCCQNISGKFARKFLPGNSPGKFLPENSREISPGKLPGKFLPENSPEFSSGKLPGNHFGKTPGKFLPENSPEISSGKLPGNFSREICPEFCPGNKVLSISLHGSGAVLRFSPW